MAELDISKLIRQIDTIHRELGEISVTQRRGMRSALRVEDIFEENPGPVDQAKIDQLRNMISEADSEEEKLRLEKIAFGCMDLALESEVASLTDMMNFYTSGGRMHVNGEKIPLVEAVPWLQAQPDFNKREKMQSECSIFFKGIINPILTGVIEVTAKLCQERFGYKTYSDYCAAKKKVNFNLLAREYEDYLSQTDDIYNSLMAPWVEESIGRPFSEGLSRYHALYLVRIKEFDQHFPMAKLDQTVKNTFSGLGFDLDANSGVTMDTSVYEAKNPDGICVGVEIPGDIHVLMKPVGGLIDYETLLHETGHAYFLANISPGLPVEDKRLYRTPALDETFAFLFMELIGNPTWLTDMAQLTPRDADEIASVHRTRRLCLIRRHIGKFLAEKDLFDRNAFKESEMYCQRLSRATGFVYEPQGYLVDMSSDFYALDYITAWSCVEKLKERLEDDFGQNWYSSKSAGEFLRSIAESGRKYSAEEALMKAGCKSPSVPSYQAP